MTKDQTNRVFYTPSEVAKIFTVTERTLRNWEQEGPFPKRVLLRDGGRRKGYFVHEIEDYLQRRETGKKWEPSDAGRMREDA